MKVFNVPSYLEDLTGLTQLLQDTRVSEVSVKNYCFHICLILKWSRSLASAWGRLCVDRLGVRLGLCTNPFMETDSTGH